jgi:general secretion pathway protein G
MKQAFSLIELIFAILVIAIITSVAAPKLFDFTNKATVTTITQDVGTIKTSIQNHYAMNGEINKISDSVNLNTKNWDINDTIVTYSDNGSECLTIELNTNTLDITINDNISDICTEIKSNGVITETIELVK